MRLTRGVIRGVGAVLVGLAAACGKTGNVSASDVVVQFYVTLELSGVREVPEPRALLALEPYLTDSLAAALRRARVVRDGGATPPAGAAPAFTDGNPFSGFYEGHSTFLVRGATERGDSAFVTVAFTNTEQKPPVTWSDTVVLVRVPAVPSDQPATTKAGAAPVWRIADLRYGGNWEFGYRGSLRQVLRRDPATVPLVPATR